MEDFKERLQEYQERGFAESALYAGLVSAIACTVAAKDMVWDDAEKVRQVTAYLHAFNEVVPDKGIADAFKGGA